MGAPNGGAALPVRLKLLDELAFSHDGKIDFVDNAIDRPPAPSAPALCSPTRLGKFTPACLRVSGWRPHRPKNETARARRCHRAEQVRKFVLVVDAKTSPGRNHVTLGPVVDGLASSRRA